MLETPEAASAKRERPASFFFLLSSHHLFLETLPNQCWLSTMCLQAPCPQDSALAPFHVPSEDAKQLVFQELPLGCERHLKHKD